MNYSGAPASSLFPTLIEWLFEASRLSRYWPVVLSSRDFFPIPCEQFTLLLLPSSSLYSVVFSRDIRLPVWWVEGSRRYV